MGGDGPAILFQACLHKTARQHGQPSRSAPWAADRLLPAIRHYICVPGGRACPSPAHLRRMDDPDGVLVSTQVPGDTRSWSAICIYTSTQPVCSSPSPSRSSVTIPRSERTTSPGAEAVTQAVETAQAGSPVMGAKSSAPRGVPVRQAMCGPEVRLQSSPGVKGSSRVGCTRSGGKSGSTLAAACQGSPNIASYIARNPCGPYSASSQSCWWQIKLGSKVLDRHRTGVQARADAHVGISWGRSARSACPAASRNSRC